VLLVTTGLSNYDIDRYNGAWHEQGHTARTAARKALWSFVDAPRVVQGSPPPEEFRFREDAKDGRADRSPGVDHLRRRCHRLGHSLRLLALADPSADSEPELSIEEGE
jgi:hypothetical protein